MLEFRKKFVCIECIYKKGLLIMLRYFILEIICKFINLFFLQKQRLFFYVQYFFMLKYFLILGKLIFFQLIVIFVILIEFVLWRNFFFWCYIVFYILNLSFMMLLFKMLREICSLICIQVMKLLVYLRFVVGFFCLIVFGIFKKLFY